MIYSMTGYGRAEGQIGNKEISIEIKSLNGKQFELNQRFNNWLKPYETEIRSLLNQLLKRGSVELNAVIVQNGATKPMQINTAIAKSYLEAVRQIANDMHWDMDEQQGHILQAVLRMPEVVSVENDYLSEEEWVAIKSLIEQATNQLASYRRQEGRGIEQDLHQRIGNILQLLAAVAPLESNRIERIRTRITNLLEEWVGKEKTDVNRLEQELVYFVEKIDFSEEKQRLTAHCNYFYQLLNEADQEAIGKKLGFVAQEIGREINTLGSKANDAEIQKIVVNMKDELEKIKEQILNVL